MIPAIFATFAWLPPIPRIVCSGVVAIFFVWAILRIVSFVISLLKFW